MSKFLHHDDNADDARAVTIPRRFLRKQLVLHDDDDPDADDARAMTIPRHFLRKQLS